MRGRAQTHLWWLALACVVAGLWTSGCDGDDDDGDDDGAPETAAPSLSDPVALDDHLLLLRVDSDLAYLVDVASDAPTLQPHALPPGVAHAEARRGDHAQALVLSRGLRGVGQGATLTVIDADGTQVRHDLDAPFDSLSQDAEGRHAVAYHRRAPEQVVFSPNAIDVVALDADGDGTTHVVLRSPGGAPLQVVATPPLQVAASTLRLAVVLSHNHVSLIDLDRPQDGELTVQLGGDLTGSVTPAEVAFEPGAGRMHVRCADSDDIFSLTLTPPPAGRRGSFGVAVLQVAGGRSPSGLAALDDAGEPRLVVASELDAELRVIDPRDGNAVVVPMNVNQNRALAFHADAPSTTDGLLLYRPGGDRVSFVDADGFARDPGGHVSDLQVEAAVEGLQLLPGTALALVEHGPALFGVLDLQQQSELLLGLRSESATLLADGAAPALWAISAGDHLAGYLDYASGLGGEVLLRTPIALGALVPGANRVVLVHDDGSLSILDDAAPDVDAVVEVAGPR